MGLQSPQELSKKINQKLQDKRLASYGLKARVYDAGNVQLQGIVDVLEEKLEAERLIREIPGIHKIDNDITVCTDGDIDDRDVAFEVGEELTANPDIPETVGAQVFHGEVRLVGSVASLSEAREAIETAGKARGVREVHSGLRLADEYDDATITNNVQTAFQNEPELVPGRIRMEVHNGILNLAGNLPEKQAELALKIAADVPGVKVIRNRLNKDEAEMKDRIVTKFMDLISANPYLNESPIDISLENGRITLDGSVDSLEGKRDLDKAIQDVMDDIAGENYQVNNSVRLE